MVIRALSVSASEPCVLKTSSMGAELKVMRAWMGTLLLLIMPKMPAIINKSKRS